MTTILTRQQMRNLYEALPRSDTQDQDKSLKNHNEKLKINVFVHSEQNKNKNHKTIFDEIKEKQKNKGIL